MTKYKVIDVGEFEDEPIANIWLTDDGQGNVDLVINNVMVAFFNNKGELWCVNFRPGEIGPLQRAGIKFKRGKGENEEFFNIKIG